MRIAKLKNKSHLPPLATCCKKQQEHWIDSKAQEEVFTVDDSKPLIPSHSSCRYCGFAVDTWCINVTNTVYSPLVSGYMPLDILDINSGGEA